MLLLVLLLVCILIMYRPKHKSVVTKTYNKEYSDMYDAVWYDKERYDKEATFIARMVERSPSSVLDIGCGTGNHMHAWKHVWPKSNIIGADISEDQLSKAREKHPTLKFVRGSYLDESLFDRDSFDVIACMYGAGQYTDKVDTLLRNAHTWLKPGGVYVFHGIDPARLCDGCHETASTSSLPLKVDSEGHCNVFYPEFVYSSWWTQSLFSNWVRYNETFYETSGGEWDVSRHVGRNVPLGMQTHPRLPNLKTNGHELYLLPPSEMIRRGRRTGFANGKLWKLRGQGSEEYFIIFRKD